MHYLYIKSNNYVTAIKYMYNDEATVVDLNILPPHNLRQKTLQLGSISCTLLLPKAVLTADQLLDILMFNLATHTKTGQET